VALQPDDARILFNLGAAYLRQNSFDPAVKTFLKVIQLDPKAGDAHHGLAYGYYMLQKYDLAWNHLNAARKLGVKVPDDLNKAIRSQAKTK
jgi:tetratricopeptide (TPR) repeat protein